MESTSQIDTISSGTLRVVRATWADSLARILANAASPPVAVAAMVALISHEIGTALAWGWATTFLLIAVIPPLAYVAHLVKSGQISDMHVPIREERTRPFITALACAALGWAALYAGGAPKLMIAMATAGWLQAALLAMITLRWKVSTHSAAIAGLAVLSTWLLGPIGFAVGAVVPLVAWSRIHLRRHDLSQTVVGAAIGACATVVALAGIL